MIAQGLEQMGIEIMDFLEYHRLHPEYTIVIGPLMRDQPRVYCDAELEGLPLELTTIAPYRRGGRARPNLNQTLTHSQCAECLRVLRNDMFHCSLSVQKKNNVSTYCRECVKVRHADYYVDAAHGAHVERQYGITKSQYEVLLAKQEGVCAICGKVDKGQSNTGKLVQLSVDHNHITGDVRGLLCGNCNRAIGLLNDDVEILQKAIEYLSND